MIYAPQSIHGHYTCQALYMTKGKALRCKNRFKQKRHANCFFVLYPVDKGYKMQSCRTILTSLYCKCIQFSEKRDETLSKNPVFYGL